MSNLGELSKKKMATRETATLKELAYVRRRPVMGRSTRSTNSRAVTSKSHDRRSTYQQAQKDGKALDFVYYSDSSEDEHEVEKEDPSNDISCNFVDCIANRERGCDRKFQTQRLTSEYATRHILSNNMLKEYPVMHGDKNEMSKVFCSQWLSYKQVIFGTKCNKLMVLDVNSKRMEQIPSLVSSQGSVPPDQDCGIHCIEINPSRTLLATGAKNSNDVAVYRLPTLDPICVGENAHCDWIFDQTWLDDQFLVSGSRDGSIALWKVTDDMIDQATNSSHIPSYKHISPILHKKCKQADRVRSLCYNHRTQEIAVVSLNGYIHCWNALKMKQVMSKRLPRSQENVCLSADEEHQMYAVGSKAHTDLLDSRTLQSVRKIPSRYQGCGIRSVSFKGNIITVGTGIGLMLFWDLRACKFLESNLNTRVQLKASRGWVRRNDIFLVGFQNQSYLPAIYTHCYNSSGTRLFAAGGPLQCGVTGNYIGLWQ